MKRKIYKLLSSAKQILFALALIVFSGTVYSQATYTFNFTGIVQTISLPAGAYSIECWGADGGTNSANSGTFPGKGGYSKGSITLSAATIYSIYVGGKGNGGVQPLGGFNSGNGITKTNLTGATGGGGASDVRVLLDDFSHRIIVAGGGGGQGNTTGTGGNGGGLIGQNGQGSVVNIGMGGTQTAPGVYPGGGDSKPAVFGEGSDGPAGTTGGQGGGGWYGGSFGTRTNGGGAGGSGYVLTSTSSIPSGYFSAYTNYYFNNTVTLRADESGFVPNPDLTGNGRVLITELCSVKIYASGSNSINPTICSGQSLTLTTTAVSNYTWSNGNTTNTMIVVSPTSSQSYSIIGTSSAACVSSGNISVTVNAALPVLTITNTPTSICLGKTATITAGGATSYTWAGGTFTNGVSFVPGPGVNVYTVSGQNGCGISVATTTLTVAALPVTASASSTLICAGTTATLSASSAVSGYTWMPNSIPGGTVTVAPSANTVYTVTASDGTCAGVAYVTVNTNPNPTIMIVPSATMVCEGAAVTLTASGAQTYTWTQGSASTTPVISDNPTSATNYIVMATNAGNCTSSASQIILTMPSPTIPIVATKTLACAGSNVTLTASGAGTYSWVGGPVSNSYVVTPTANTTYTVIGTSSTNTCTTTKMINVSVIIASVNVAASSMSVCSGGATTLTASGATTYSWVGAFLMGSTYVPTPTITTSYVVNATTSAVGGPNCPSSNTITISIFTDPVVSISSTKTVVCKQDAALLLTGVGAATYTWNTNVVAPTLTVHPQSTTTYTVTGMDANGCINTGTLKITVNPCTGIVELNENKQTIMVYPNPNAGDFTVSSDSSIRLKVISELGQELQILNLSDLNDHKATVNNLAGGVYFIVGQNENGSVNQKIVVTK